MERAALLTLADDEAKLARTRKRALAVVACLMIGPGRCRFE